MTQDDGTGEVIQVGSDVSRLARCDEVIEDPRSQQQQQ